MTSRIALVLFVLTGCHAQTSGGVVRVDRERALAAITRGADALVARQRQDGAIADPANPLFETWETVLSAKALAATHDSKFKDALWKAMLFLHDNETAEGLVCHNRRCREVACVETSGEYVLLLSQLQESLGARGQALAKLQLDTGEWLIGNPDVREQRDFPSVTGFALAALHASKVPPRNEAQAYAWLVTEEGGHGEWGNAWEYYATPAYALWANLRALHGVSTPEVTALRTRATAFIRGAQRSDGSWYYAAPDRSRWPSAELQTALMLSALAYADPAENDAALRAGFAYLLTHQRFDGTWDGGFFPIDSPRYVKEEHLFATAQIVTVLQWALDGRTRP